MWNAQKNKKRRCQQLMMNLQKWLQTNDEIQLKEYEI